MKTRRPRLIAFQFAGGNRHAYRSLQRELDPQIELCCFELPGRGRRHSEALLTDLRSMVKDLLGPIADSVAGGPYALFGHSMGSQLARLASRLLLEQGVPAPRCLIVSASPAPCRPLRTERHRLSSVDFLRELRRLGGCAPEVLSNAELIALVLPVLRADFQAIETYRADAGPPLSCPILVLRGLEDGEVTRADAEAWRAETTGSFEMHDLPGGHFFLFAHLRQVAAWIEHAVGGPDPSA